MLNLKKIREENKIQQKTLSNKLNRTIACISSWETGKTEPSIDDLIQLANVLNVSIDYLVNRTDEYGLISVKDNISKLELEIVEKLHYLKLEEQYQVLGFIKSFLHYKM